MYISLYSTVLGSPVNNSSTTTGSKRRAIDNGDDRPAKTTFKMADPQVVAAPPAITSSRLVTTTCRTMPLRGEVLTSSVC